MAYKHGLQVEVKLRLPGREAYEQVAALLDAGKKATYAQVGDALMHEGLSCESHPIPRPLPGNYCRFECTVARFC